MGEKKICDEQKCQFSVKTGAEPALACSASLASPHPIPVRAASKFE